MTAKVTVRLTPETHTQFKVAAARSGTSMERLLRGWIDEYVADNDGTPPAASATPFQKPAMQHIGRRSDPPVDRDSRSASAAKIDVADCTAKPAYLITCTRCGGQGKDHPYLQKKTA